MLNEFLEYLDESIKSKNDSRCCPTDREAVKGSYLHHDGHDCPNPLCDGKQWLCREGRPQTHHTHVCRKCGTTWEHGPGGE